MLLLLLSLLLLLTMKEQHGATGVDNSAASADIDNSAAAANDDDDAAAADDVHTHPPQWIQIFVYIIFDVIDKWIVSIVDK